MLTDLSDTDGGRTSVGRPDRGSAMIMAILVSLIVFMLALTWTSMASHESSASNADRRRQNAIDAAMAGLVVADSRLTRDSAFTTTGLVGFAGGGAEFEVSVTLPPEAPGGLRRVLTSVGYAPSKSASPRTVRTVQQVVELTPLGFTYGVFSEGQFVTGSASTVIGDIYTNLDITLGNSQDFSGQIYTQGHIRTGSNQTITGSLHANGNIYVESNSTTVNSSAYSQGNILTGGTIRDTAQASGTIGCVEVLGSCLPGAPPLPVPGQSLPTFTWSAANYPTGVTSPATGAAFVSLVSKKDAHGVFYVDGDIDFAKNDALWLTGDMTIVATGSVALPGSIINKVVDGEVQLTVISSGAGAIVPANGLTIPATVRTLIYTKGNFDAKNASAFSGVLYAGNVTAGAHLSVTYAPVGAPGFNWSATAQSFTIRNVTTREIANVP
jgi:Tfp pilus assembly protein PilX